MLCKNDPSKSYSGTEPSPKGLGLCAHAENAGKVSRGKDGRLWEVRLDKNGTKSWKHLKGPAWPYGPMTLPRALKALSIGEADADSIVDLKVAMLKAVDAFRLKWPTTDSVGYRPEEIYKAYRFLLARVCRRGLAPESIVKWVLPGASKKKSGKWPVAYESLMKKAQRKYAASKKSPAERQPRVRQALG